MTRAESFWEDYDKVGNRWEGKYAPVFDYCTAMRIFLSDFALYAQELERKVKELKETLANMDEYDIEASEARQKLFTKEDKS